jgi:hypothetical protein
MCQISLMRWRLSCTGSRSNFPLVIQLLFHFIARSYKVNRIPSGSNWMSSLYQNQNHRSNTSCVWLRQSLLVEQIRDGSYSWADFVGSVPFVLLLPSAYWRLSIHFSQELIHLVHNRRCLLCVLGKKIMLSFVDVELLLTGDRENPSQLVRREACLCLCSCVLADNYETCCCCWSWILSCWMIRLGGKRCVDNLSWIKICCEIIRRLHVPDLYEK